MNDATPSRPESAPSDSDEQLRQRTAELSASVRERDLLLREVHHRVKNNLQLITSLINMQIRRLPSESESSLALVECKRRVEAIGLIHQELYESHNYAQIPFSGYVRTLASNLLNSSTTTRGIRLQCECESITLPVDRAISCGLLLNELITCALSHAEFSVIDELRIVMLHRDEQIHLQVSTGPNTPTANVNEGPAASLGLQLADMLAQQLDGQLQVRPDGSATVTMPSTNEL